MKYFQIIRIFTDLHRAEMVELGHVQLENGQRRGAHACAQLLTQLYAFFRLQNIYHLVQKKSQIKSATGWLYLVETV